MQDYIDDLRALLEKHPVDDNALLAEARELFGEEHPGYLLLSMALSQHKKSYDDWQKRRKKRPTNKPQNKVPIEPVDNV
jgi:hypothetical protein